MAVNVFHIMSHGKLPILPQGAEHGDAVKADSGIHRKRLFYLQKL